uniref:Col_cuticle_N domain-containing protein n=1 Tax=Nippostrongylus brasiliensis TaxID=27835 RepID=A0A0N4XH24_NIPBR
LSGFVKILVCRIVKCSELFWNSNVHFIYQTSNTLELYYGLMVPVRSVRDGGDQKPLSPSGEDVNANNKSKSLGHENLAYDDSATTAERNAVRTSGVDDTQMQFSCVPIYVVIILAIFLVLVVGAITTLIDLKPEIIYGRRVNGTSNISTLRVLCAHPPITFCHWQRSLIVAVRPQR